MAVKVKEKEMKLQTYFVDESTGKERRKIVTISGINPEASMDNLYKLSEDLNPLVDGDFITSKRVTGETMGKMD